MTVERMHRRSSLPFKAIPEDARYWVLWPTPKGWEKDIQTEKDASLAADSWVVGHARAHTDDVHKCYVAENAPGIAREILVVCETCPRPTTGR